MRDAEYEIRVSWIAESLYWRVVSTTD